MAAQGVFISIGKNLSRKVDQTVVMVAAVVM